MGRKWWSAGPRAFGSGGGWTHPDPAGLGLTAYTGPVQSAPALWVPSGTPLPRATWFLLWALAGAAGGIAVLGMLTFGLFVLPLALIAVVALAVIKRVASSWPGLISGLGVPLLYVAWLNRSGPGTTCVTEGTVTECTDQLNPWPFVAIGLALIVLGVAAFWMVRERMIRTQLADAQHIPTDWM